MATDYRVCAGSSNFNTGASKCPLDPDKIKGVILVHHGYKLGTLTKEELEKRCHADRPNRIYPIGPIVEYAPNGGEAETNATGYGPSKITGYSARTDIFTLQDPDISLRANLVAAKSVLFDMYPYDANNVIYGVNDGTDQLAGIELSGVYPGGQDWDSSGTEANLTFNAMLKDVEKYLKNADVKQVDFDLQSLNGLVYVDFLKLSTGSYKLIEHFGGLDVTPYYGEEIASQATKAVSGVTAMTYDATNQVLAVTGSGNPVLKTPAELFTAGIVGIEQYSLTPVNGASAAALNETGL